MKAKVHPNYTHEAVVTCACGNTFTTGSVLNKIQVDICSACHPFYTGEMRFVDTQGRVEKFQQKFNAAAGKNYVSKKQRKASEAVSTEAATPKTLREMIEEQRKRPTKRNYIKIKSQDMSSVDPGQNLAFL